MTAPACPDLVLAAVPHMGRTRILVVTSFVDEDAGDVSVILADRSADHHAGDTREVHLPAVDALAVADGIRAAVDDATAMLSAYRRRSA